MRVLGVQLVFMLLSQLVDCDKPGSLDLNLGFLDIGTSLGVAVDPPGVGPWEKVDVAGAQCSDGSPYKIFVSRSSVSSNLLILLEPGGACWDFESCSGQGLRGAANPHGIPDDHMNTWQHAHPAASGLFGQDGKFATWNKVFVPYCTGDVHVGSRVVTYTSEDGAQTLEYRHVGFDNMQLVTAWLAENFNAVPQMVVSGCSAGGAGALLNYPLLRAGMPGVERGYLLDDSGPIFPSDGPSLPLHQRIAEEWNLSAIINAYSAAMGDEAGAAVAADFGTVNSVIADAFPNDRLALVAFQRDLNYSLYSYDSFYDHPPYETIAQYWQDDLNALRAQYDAKPNLAYYLPYYRTDNCSHCATIIPRDHVEELLFGLRSPWSGTEIQDAGMTLPAFIDLLLDDSQPLQSYAEGDNRDGEFSSEHIAQCRQ